MPNGSRRTIWSGRSRASSPNCAAGRSKITGIWWPTAWRLQSFHPTAAAAMECAILDAYTRIAEAIARRFSRRQKRSDRNRPDAFRRHAQRARRQLARNAAKKGFRRFKVKLERLFSGRRFCGCGPSTKVRPARASGRRWQSRFRPFASDRFRASLEARANSPGIFRTTFPQA